MFSLLLASSLLASSALAEDLGDGSFRTGVYVPRTWDNANITGDTPEFVASQVAGYIEANAEGRGYIVYVNSTCDVLADARNWENCDGRYAAMSQALHEEGVHPIRPEGYNNMSAQVGDRRAYVRVEFLDQPEPIQAAPIEPRPCYLTEGPNLTWDDTEIKRSYEQWTTLEWRCPDGGDPLKAKISEVESPFALIGEEEIVLSPNKVVQLGVIFTPDDFEEHPLTINVTGGSESVELKGQAQARVTPESTSYEPCPWGFGANIGVNFSLQAVVGTVAIDGLIPVPLKEGRCNAVRLFLGGGLTPGRDEVTYLDQRQTVGAGTASTYFGGATYQWGEGVKTFEVGAWLQAVRVHWDGTPDLYQAGPRLAWAPRFGVAQVQLWGSPGLMWGYAEGGSTGWSSAFGQTAMDNADRIQPTVAVGLNLGFRL